MFIDKAERKDIRLLFSTYLPIVQVYLPYFGLQDQYAPQFFSVSIPFLISCLSSSKLFFSHCQHKYQGTTCWLLFEQGMCLLALLWVTFPVYHHSTFPSTFIPGCPFDSLSCVINARLSTFISILLQYLTLASNPALNFSSILLHHLFAAGFPSLLLFFF